MTYADAYSKLEIYDQLHLLKYFDELSDTEKMDLLNQIEMIDFNLLKLVEHKELQHSRGKFDPIGTLTCDEIEANKDRYYHIGINAIREGKVGAVLLAGGQGTRLGFDGPKGSLNVGINKTIYLFELLIQNILETVERSGSWVPLFIMTSDKNNDETIDFFEENNYFGYNRKYITFFIQDMAPSVDYNGKIYMEDKGIVSMSPNGNGGWFTSLDKAGILRNIKASGIQWLNVFSVDNVLQKIADPYFVGATIESNCVSGSKVVRKAFPEEKVGVLCLEDGKPSIVEYYEMSEEMMYLKNEAGELLYNFGVILNYLFHVDELEKINNQQLPVHIVEKKIPYMEEEQKYIKPESPNGYKFETLVLDMIHMLENCLSFEVIRNKEFAPIKNKTGVDSLETARALLQENGLNL